MEEHTEEGDGGGQVGIIAAPLWSLNSLMRYSTEEEQFELDSVNRNGYEPIAKSENSRVPPDYLVREAKDGRLLSDSYGVEWPKRPQFGRYAEGSSENGSASYVKEFDRHSSRKYRSKETLYRKKKDHRKIRDYVKNGHAYYPDEKGKADKRDEDMEENNYLFVAKIFCERRKDEQIIFAFDCSKSILFGFYKGARTMSGVSKLLRPNDFRLYYQVSSSSENAIPIHIPLVLAYMSASGKIYHFPIACTKDERNGKELWHVLYGDPRPSTFPTLSALVKYHKIYCYMDPKTGAIDTFPVWKGAVIDMDEMD